MLEGSPHKGEAGGIQRGRGATAMRLGCDVPCMTIAREEIADTTETEPKADCQLPHRTLVVLIRLYHADAQICRGGAPTYLL